MAKKFWIKLEKDFFSDPKIKKIRKLAGGDTYSCIYLQLLLLSLDSEGVIFFENIEPTIEEELALRIDEETINIKAALAIFDSLGLLEKGENDNLRFPKAIELSGGECDSAERVRKFRAKSKEVPVLQCNHEVTNSNESEKKCNLKIKIKKEKELKKELELKKEKKSACEKNSPDAFVLPEWVDKKIWQEFLEMRAKIKKPPTLKAKELIIKELRHLGEEHANQILEQSILNSWQDVYPLRNKSSPIANPHNFSKNSLATQQQMAEVERILEQKEGV